MIKIIPTIFGMNIEEIENRLKRAIGFSKEVQIDFMDGDFVAKKSPMPEEIPEFNKGKKIIAEAHLMCYSPSSYFKMLAHKGFKKVLFHYEGCKTKEEILNTINEAKKYRLKVFMVINPETPTRCIIPYLGSIDGIMVMGVHPGKENQTFLENTTLKVDEIRQKDSKIDIQIDGGVNESTIEELAEAGATIFSVGSAFANTPNPRQEMKILEKIALGK